MKIDKVDVINAGHEDAWKYFTSAYNGYEAMRAYRHMIKDCLDRKKANFESIRKGEAEISEKEKYSFPPGDFIKIDGINMSLSFLVSVYTQSFFQFGRNCFDYIAQIITVFYCQGINFYHVDFGAVANKKDSITDEHVRKYIEDIITSEEYKYFCDYNNTVKHSYALYVSIYMKVSNMDLIGKIPSFEKDSRLYNVADIDEKLKKNHQILLINMGIC
ncbi:MAG: hypothetical protein K6G24_08625 [Lachnospiraceae bacterium]|nr:hypothetical protein [Lachnospiraceae bacterium]